ncbi:PglZ domain-containing protein [Euzebya sp.]|uniref:PglZ domain-containing protein n=1 Tax=Euzebya sp. TaxID=1971409 RepID=UPI003510D3AF
MSAGNAARPVVVLDPHAVASEDELRTGTHADVVASSTDWFSLRQVWERHGRDPHGSRVTIHVLDALHQPADLPWDIEQGATVCRLRVPPDPTVRALVLAVTDEDSDRLMAVVDSTPTATGLDLLAALAGVSRDALDDRPGRVRAALRLLRAGQSHTVLSYARQALGPDPVLEGALDAVPSFDPLKELWDEWVTSPDDPDLSQLFDACRTEVSDLFLDGTLQPSLAATAVIPRWARLGTREASPAERLQSLMAQQPPTPLPTAPLEPWLPVAAWWGSVRNELAQVNPPDEQLAASAWAVWDGIDAAFLTWIRQSYGAQLGRNWVNGPKGLHQVQPYLAKQAGQDGRVLLLVFDGMSHTLWTQIRSGARMTVLHSSGTLTMLPSLTEISRQAIAAADLPTAFLDTLNPSDLTEAEPVHWARAWATHERSAGWLRVDGGLADLSKVPLGHHDAIGVVISATDKQMHAARMMGDVGLHAGMKAWLRSGFLDRLLEAAEQHGYEVWVTTDHGGIECLPTKGPNEGALVPRAGTRHRRYANKTLRDAAVAEGIVLDSVPGLPATYGDCLLFAPGRVSWKQARISHGGLSLDEVVVPFAKVVAG